MEDLRAGGGAREVALGEHVGNVGAGGGIGELGGSTVDLRDILI